MPIRNVTCPVCHQEVELRDLDGDVPYLTMHIHPSPALERAVSGVVVTAWAVRCPGSLQRCERRTAPPPFRIG